ncbi:hypothetical protein EXIGLDRAFT_843450 [Exidia glandulosa HHB12029]|uniref:Uncharacterized protein n=1 Tax=Exidia glandulosa HHB12029 TaxID=1314781 RepID=A0A165CN05_EXIGL|nr:hypothetical protein EXIGLDRAFT_843450 [Exidia glandulosa HHB12029]
MKRPSPRLTPAQPATALVSYHHARGRDLRPGRVDALRHARRLLRTTTWAPERHKTQNESVDALFARVDSDDEADHRTPRALYYGGDGGDGGAPIHTNGVAARRSGSITPRARSEPPRGDTCDQLAAGERSTASGEQQPASATSKPGPMRVVRSSTSPAALVNPTSPRQSIIERGTALGFSFSTAALPSLSMSSATSIRSFAYYPGTPPSSLILKSGPTSPNGRAFDADAASERLRRLSGLVQFSDIGLNCYADDCDESEQTSNDYRDAEGVGSDAYGGWWTMRTPSRTVPS